MTSRAPAGAFLRLSGLRQHLAGIERDLRDGLSCLWILPSSLVEGTAADQYVEELRAALENVVEVPGPAGAGSGPSSPRAAAAPPCTASSGDWYDDGPDDGFLDDYDDGLGDPHWPSGVTVSRPPDPHTGSALEERLARELGVFGDPVDYLTSEEAAGAPVIMVRGWYEEDKESLARLLRRLTAAVKGSGLPPERRPRLFVAARVDDLAGDVHESLDAAFGRVHWWWSVWGRLDTATVIAEAATTPLSGVGPGSPLKRIHDAVRAETVTEVSGPDMGLAVGLTGDWDGLPSSLRACLVTLCPAEEGSPADVPTCAQAVGPAATAYAAAPAPSVRGQWSAGLLDGWEGQLRLSVPVWIAGAGSQAQLDKLVWQSQNRVLLPLIDDARAELASRLHEFAPHGIRRLHLLYQDRYATVADLGSMELGDIWSGVKQGCIRVSGMQYDRLKTLRHARNELAHRRPLNDRSLEATVRVLAQHR
ncbi:hypothetical protein AB0P15_24050 [Streptomyces sp. NPDC087917]|uniref:hypothetical protein n=1 Tax=unclassified Streptomyces TaxID=2593676 RepID=UPI003422A0CE